MPRLIQNRLEPLYEIKKFRGIDNLVTDDLRLDPGFVRKLDNIDIDSEQMARMRKGILKQLQSGNAHSGWSDEAQLCFLVLNNNLVQLNTDGTVTNILSNVGPSHVEFLQLGDRVFFSNRIMVGYIQNGIAYGFPDTVRKDRQKMIGGKLIEYCNARLYSCDDTFIYRSISGNPFEMDIKRDQIDLGGNYTMLKAVNRPGGEIGLYVSSGTKCYYLDNLEPSLEEARCRTLLDVPALPGSACAIERMDIGRRMVGLEGRCCIWSTVIGIFMGFAGGFVKDCTSEHYAVMDIEEGYSYIKWHMGYRQYVFMGQVAPGVGLTRLQAIDPYDTAQITFQ
jgi:hypothetical protein